MDNVEFYIGEFVIRHLVQRPDYRNHGQYQFVTWYTGGGAEACVHLTREQISDRLRDQKGPGILVDDGENLWWEQGVE